MQQTNQCMVLHADLFVSAMNDALDFYCTKLGFALVDDSIIRGPIVISLSRGTFAEARLVLLRISRSGALLELQQFQAASALTANSDLVPERSLVTFLVADLHAQIARIKDNGLSPSSEIFVVSLPRQGSCEVVFYEDPDGNRLEFIQMRQPPR